MLLFGWTTDCKFDTMLLRVKMLLLPETVMAVPALSEDTPTSYLKTLLPKWKKLKDSLTESAGSPLVVILTSSAIRATQLIR